ncbi:MAG TPA: transcriptional repressor LexA [Pyrinomonadaceae bacterium]|jgi:repressor LexA
MQPRTQRQKEIFDYISHFIERHGYEPSYAQIARHFQISSKATIAKHIEALEKRGLLSREHANGSFALRVQFEDVATDATCDVPLLGRVAAGAPLEAFTDAAAQTVTVPRFLLGRVRPEQVYALKVTGDSMIDEHICDGDIALVENRVEARDGEIVVALVDGQRATLKRLFRFGREVELRPANSQLEPIRLPAYQVQVQGIFRGLLRPAV